MIRVPETEKRRMESPVQPDRVPLITRLPSDEPPPPQPVRAAAEMRAAAAKVWTERRDLWNGIDFIVFPEEMMPERSLAGQAKYKVRSGNFCQGKSPPMAGFPDAVDA